MPTLKLEYSVEIEHEQDAETELKNIEGVEFIGPKTIKLTAPSIEELKHKHIFQVRRVTGLISTSTIDVEC